MSSPLHKTTTEIDGTASTEAAPLGSHPESRVYIELRTETAYRLVVGRPRTELKPAINGLLSFASLLREVWDVARNGDPFARWWLVKVEVALGRAETTLEPALRAVLKTLSASAPLEIDHSRGRPPRRLELLFACPYAYHAAHLVKNFDLLVTQLHMGVQVGVLRKAETTGSRQRCERAMRRLFTAPQGFWNFGVTDGLVQCRDPKAIDAAAKMGELPDDIRSGECWPTLLDPYGVTSADRSDRDEAQTDV